MKAEISQKLPDEDAEIAAILEQAKALVTRARELHKARLALEEAPKCKGSQGQTVPAYDGSLRSYHLNWAAHHAGGLVQNLETAVRSSVRQEKYWYARELVPNEGTSHDD